MSWHEVVGEHPPNLPQFQVRVRFHSAQTVDRLQQYRAQEGVDTENVRSWRPKRQQPLQEDHPPVPRAQ
jgi:hypothetical protein